MDWILPIILTIITAATPLVFASLGELVTEKSGVLNLGVEGMMIMGAIVAFAIGVNTDNAMLAFVGGIVGGAMIAAVFGVVVLFLLANQVAAGLALTLLGLGVSALIGHSFVGVTFPGIVKLYIPGLSDIPFLGKIFFHQDAMVYLSLFMAIAIYWFLHNTRAGLVLRSVGENHDAAHALGISVVRVRFLAIVFGGAMAGTGGAYLSIVYTPLWVEGMTAGRGWIALALVVFAAWRVERVVIGAYLFGGISIVQLHGQGWGISIPAPIMAMMPYIATIVVLVIISRETSKLKLNAPGSLGRNFFATT